MTATKTEPRPKSKAKPAFAFRPGARVQGVEAEAAGRELARIGRREPLTPAAVVETASDPDSPLHPAFEWDDAAAAHEHRLQQARVLIRAVCVTYEPTAAPRPVYVHVDTGDGGRYERVSVVVESPDLYASALASLKGKLRSAEQAVSELEAAAKRGHRPAAQVGAIGEHLRAAIEAADGLN